MPQLGDPYFARSVVYIWRHSEEGALGLMVNKPTEMTLVDLIDDLDLEVQKKIRAPAAGGEGQDSPGLAAELQEQRIMLGGPVETDKGFILHDGTYSSQPSTQHSSQQWDATAVIAPGVNITTSPDILRAIARREGPENYLIALGCAGWEAGQLEDEISRNVWLTVPAAPELIFSRDYENKLAEVTALLGIRLDQLSAQAGHS